MVANLEFLGLELGLAFGGPQVDKMHGPFAQPKNEGQDQGWASR